MNASLNVLLVEDNEDHAELVLRSLRNHSTSSSVHHVKNGEAALNYLFRRDKYKDPAQSPSPHLVLLDLRLPKVDGLQVLESVKASADLRKIPVVVLTTSEGESDLARAYEHHVNSYLVKPIDFVKFSKMMDDLGAYWLGLNRHP